ncbi:hypothetical protein N7456_010045 [Penicillium angulare]|uniref:Retrovirus-related Pol polyprotein from transposon TNT 1-94-like beta-barrel domain-containing protein n=1 Tax=Penicillium angulare TaxID=116970 RepID=A0A9W9K5U4_9EURO|nr:hypothetical protein N7456_010045 [Penicillium angulare]
MDTTNQLEPCQSQRVLLDTGASSNTCRHADLFLNMKPSSHRFLIGGGEMIAQGKGTIRLSCKTTNGWLDLEFPDTYYVPDRFNNTDIILSFPRFVEITGARFRQTESVPYLTVKIGSNQLMIHSKRGKPYMILPHRAECQCGHQA